MLLGRELKVPALASDPILTGGADGAADERRPDFQWEQELTLVALRVLALQVIAALLNRGKRATEVRARWRASHERQHQRQDHPLRGPHLAAVMRP
jgi:hypothetical protein